MPRGRSGHARPPALQTGAVQAAVLASRTAASGDILHIRRSDNTGLVNAQEWFWPSQPAPGQQVRMLTIAGGMEIEGTFYATATAIELSAAGRNGLREFLWLNARTHLPMRQVKENWNGPGSRLQRDIEYLPATPANQAMLTPAIPRGYERAPAP